MPDPTARDGEIIDAAELKRTKALLKMAERHAMNCDASQAEAEAKLARAEARYAGLNAHHLRAVADHRAELDAMRERAEQAEYELALLTRSAKTVTGNDWYGRIARSEATIERVKALRDHWVHTHAIDAANELSAALNPPEGNADAPKPVTAATDTGLRERLHEAISGSWSTMPTCWEAQIRAVLAVLHVEDDMDLRDLIGPMLDAAQVRDADGVTALVVDVIWPVVEQLRAERDAAQAAVNAQGATEAHGGAGEAREGSQWAR